MLLLALIPIKDAQRDTDTQAYVRVQWRRLVRCIDTECRVCRTVRNCKLVIGSCLFERLLRFLQIRAAVYSQSSEIRERRHWFLEIERLRHVELFHRSRVSQQRDQIDLCGPQIDLRSFQIRFELDALQVYPLEIDLRNIAGLEPFPADRNLFIVVIEIFLRHLPYGLGQQHAHEGVPQGEHQVSFQIRLSRYGNCSRLLCARQPQFALVVPLVQVSYTAEQI